MSSKINADSVMNALNMINLVLAKSTSTNIEVTIENLGISIDIEKIKHDKKYDLYEIDTITIWQPLGSTRLTIPEGMEETRKGVLKKIKNNIRV